MKNRYITTFTALCPNNNDIDTYQITIETNQFWQIEDIVAYLNAMKSKKIYQEDLNELLVKKLHTTKTSPYYRRNQGFEGRITLVGVHQGVEITTVRESAR